jgi:hypothetical protein
MKINLGRAKAHAPNKRIVVGMNEIGYLVFFLLVVGAGGGLLVSVAIDRQMRAKS